LRQVEFLRILIEERAVVKLLKTIGNREYPTRKLLKRLGAYGYGHKLLLRAERKGLVERTTVKNKIQNRLTPNGKKILKLAKEIGV
jgi:predicted transcriptional regulator